MIYEHSLRSLRNKYRGSPSVLSEPDPNRAAQVSDLIADMVTQ
jgi:hypothetical protein